MLFGDKFYAEAPNKKLLDDEFPWMITRDTFSKNLRYIKIFLGFLAGGKLFGLRCRETGCPEKAVF